MCRFALYLGPRMVISSLVEEPSHSIIRQSYQSQEREDPLNGDGFGIAWYALHLSERPAIFKDASPAWSNPNLTSISGIIESECIFAHVRAATGGLPVSQLNCHPFSWRQFTFMHNGQVGGFDEMLRPLRRTFSDEAYRTVKGQTDSEQAFGLFIDHYISYYAGDHLNAMVSALKATITTLEQLRTDYGIEECSLLNFAVTDGKVAVVSRYASDSCTEPNTLYARRVIQTGENSSENAVYIASEALSKEEGWESVEANQLMIIHSDRSLEFNVI